MEDDGGRRVRGAPPRAEMSWRGAPWGGRAPPPVPPPAVLAHSAFKLFVKNFLLCFNLRAGFSLFGRLLKVIASRGKIPLTINNVVGESHLVFRDEGVRWGLFMGGMVATHEYVRGCLAHLRSWLDPERESQDWVNSFAAGMVSAPWLLVLPPNRQEFLSLYAPARMVSAIWSWLVKRGYARALPLGSSLLFAMSSSQIMYAYVMRPESLLPSYWRFIVRSGPLARKPR